MSGVHQRAAAGVSLSSEAEVPQRPHKGVRQSAKTGELYLAHTMGHSVQKYTSVDFLMLQCQNHKEVWQCAETGEVLALYSAHFVFFDTAIPWCWLFVNFCSYPTRHSQNMFCHDCQTFAFIQHVLGPGCPGRPDTIYCTSYETFLKTCLDPGCPWRLPDIKHHMRHSKNMFRVQAACED